MLGQLLQSAYSIIEGNKFTCLSIYVLAVLVYKLLVFPFLLSPLRQIPGPYVHRISTLPALNGQRTERWIQTVYNLHVKFGPVVILSPNEVSVNGDCKFLNEIYTKNLPKSSFYQNFKNHGNKDNIFASLSNDVHLRYKKMIMSLYSKSAIFSNNNPTRDFLVEKCQKLVDQVLRSSVTGEAPDYINARSEYNHLGKGHNSQKEWFNPTGKTKNLGIDVYSLFGALAMDVVTSLELGHENGTDLLSHPEDRHIIATHRLQASMGFWTTLMPRLWSWAATPEIMKASEIIEKWQLESYESAERNPPGRRGNSNPTTLEALKRNEFSGKAAYSFLSDNIFAGHETTAIQLTYLAYELSRPQNIHMQQSLQQELNRNFGRPKTSSDTIDDLETIDKMPFLDSLLQENLRIHASIPGAEPRVTDKPFPVNLNSGQQIQIPQGTVISSQPYTMHRVASIFPEPQTFKPERWLPYDGETQVDYNHRVTMQQKYMMPFGKGIRMCLGMHLAVIEMKLAIANLYWHFSSRLCEDWCEVVTYGDKQKAANPIKMGADAVGNNETDEEKMVMVDTYTTRPYNDECWLEWYMNK